MPVMLDSGLVGLFAGFGAGSTTIASLAVVVGCPSVLPFTSDWFWFGSVCHRRCCELCWI
jgi:hypothetical protein